MKKLIRWIFATVFIGVGMVWVLRSMTQNDYRIGLISKNGVGLVSVSRQRMMMNLLQIEGDVKVWIPYGPGWYGVDKVLKFFDLDGDTKKAKDMFFYNWGFVPDYVIRVDSLDDWEQHAGWWKEWGVINWLRYKFEGGDWWYRSQEVDTEVSDWKDKLAETLVRDFADATVLGEDVRLSVYNGSETAGLAGFIGDNLDLLGVTVIGVENDSDGYSDCLIRFGGGVQNTVSGRLIRQVFGECRLEKDAEIDQGKIELYFGEKYVEMINYENYKKDF